MKSPKQIYAELSEYVIGQDHAKQVMATAMYNHYVRCQHLFTIVEEPAKKIRQYNSKTSHYFYAAKGSLHETDIC